MSDMNSLLLEVEGLKTFFPTNEGEVRAVDDLSFSLHSDSSLGIVGESGCGKSTVALSIMRLVPHPGRVVAGKINFAGQGDLLGLSISQMRKVRGRQIAMIFQEPMTCLNPVYRIDDQMAESFMLHQKLSRKDAVDMSIEMLKLVGISAPEKRARDYPHQLSGGMRQRVMIGMALSCNPKLVLADEPTTALDVTIQAQILDLINKLQDQIGTSIILITHNLGVIAEMAQHVAVMYAGVIVEYADVHELFSNPVHPYTCGLLKSIPRLDTNAKEKTRLSSIPGVVPNLLHLSKGCRFNDRCSYVQSLCKEREPVLEMVEEGHFSRCWLHTQHKQ